MSKELGFTLPKGAGEKVDKIGAEIVKKYGINKRFQKSSRYSKHSMIREFFLTLYYEQITELYYCLKTFENIPTE